MDQKGAPEKRSVPAGTSSRAVRIAAPFDSDAALMMAAGSADNRAFHLELRKRNLPMLLWTAVVFNFAYVAWGLFDYILVPEQWSLFLFFRLAAVSINTVMVAIIYRPRMRKYSFEGFWILVFVYCAFIAPMLPMAGENLSKYVMGLSVTMVGAGVIPVWHPRWPASVLLVGGLVNGLFFFLLSSAELPVREAMANAFVMLTAIGLAVLASVFKYDLAKRDFLSRVELARVARRESEARQVLADTSDDLQNALEKLKELDRLKSKFFANISHELRTPLTLILAPVAELAEGVSTEEARQQVRVIRRNAERLLSLINDLLDLSRLDAGGLRLNLAEVDIRSVAASVHENCLPAAISGEVELVLHSTAPTEKIWGDSHRLEIVLTNLVSNAIKFTPAGGRIEIRVQDLDEGVQVEVEDTGVGIPGGDLDRVFERFYQVNPGDRRREGGVGIGLALAKELVELHGGAIKVLSPETGGTTFAFVIPFGRDHIRPEVIERRQSFERPDMHRRVEDTAAPVDGADGVDVREEEGAGGVALAAPDSTTLPAGRRPRLLLVEDNPEIRNYIRTLLEPQFELVVASDGAEALVCVRSQRPDLVVSDVMMPGLTGTELCRAIKNDPSLRSIPVILLTAKVGSEATLEAYAHGADDFVAKPFHPQVLLARIRAQLKLQTMALHLAHQEKLAVVGTMSAGILHEVRNPVNAILNATRAIATNRLDEETREQMLEVIGDAAVRIEEITSALDTHARPAEAGATSVCDLAAGFDATFKLIRHRLDKVTVHRDFKTDRPAMAPAGPMNQVLLNLIDNALRVGATSLWVGLESDAGKIVATVADDGPGVVKEDADRVFDPFFTHRPGGGGTGLGLYLSRRIVEEAGGRLEVEDRPGGGALFRLEVPALPLSTAPREPHGDG